MYPLYGSIDTFAPVSTKNGKSGSSRCGAACTKSAWSFKRSLGDAGGTGVSSSPLASLSLDSHSCLRSADAECA